MVWKDWEESRDRMMSRNIVSYGVYMVHTWTIEIKSRVEGMISGHMYIACWPGGRRKMGE